MDTIDEVFQSMSQEDVIDVRTNIEYLIDNELRIITVPKNGVVLGVEGDKDVNVVHFKMPRMYRGLDLGEGFNIRVNYANAKTELGYFAVVHPDVTEDSISFEWLLGSHALMYVGEIKFAVSLIKSSVDGRIEKKFNTTLGKAKCLTGLDVDVSVPEEDVYDLLTQIKQDVMADIRPSLDGAKADAAAAKQSATQAAESAATATTGAENVRLGVEAVKNAVKIAEQTSAHVDEVKTAVEASSAAASSDAAKAEAAKTAAVTAQGNAEEAKTSAEQFKMAAEQAKNNATAQAQAAAAESAKQAKASQDAASTSAQTSSTKAEEAKTSADAAKVSETNAKAAENAATSIVENAKIVSDNVLKGEETATLINVTDAWPSKPRGMKIYGQSNQLTTTGKNLLGGERYVSGYDIRGFKNILKPNTQYTYSCSGITDGTAAFKLLAFNAEQNKGIELTVGYIKNASETFTTPENIGEFEELYLGGNYNDAGKNCINSHFQIEEGAKATSYEPYTGGKPSPSPDYPQEITNLSKAELVITGRNICPDAELLGKVGYNSEIPTNKYGVQAKFPYVQTSETDGIGAVLNTIKGVTYSIAYLGKANTAAVGIAEYKSADDVGDISKVVSYAIVGTSKKNSLTASIDGVMVFVLASQWSNGTTNINTFAKEDMIISIGEPQDSYKPHKSKSTVIDLKGNELCSLPNGVKDEVVIDAEGNVSLIKRVASTPVTSDIIQSAGEHENGQKYVTVVLNNCVRDGKPNVMCSTYISNIYTDSDKQIYIPFSIGAVITDSRFADKETAVNILTAMNLTIFYQLAEPQTIPLGKVELPALPESTSNVWNDGNIPANVYVNYLKDVNIAYSDLENQIKQIATALSVATLEIATK